MTEFDFLSKVANIGLEISNLVKQRENVVADYAPELLKKIYRMMDWDTSDVKSTRVEYSAFERRIMIEIHLKNDPNARWVFAQGKDSLQLRFREDFSKH